MLTEKKIYDINNKKNKTGNHFVLINNRNIKNNNNDQRLITDYFIIENKEKSKKTIERKINQNTIHNNNSLSIDFHNFHQASKKRFNFMVLKNLMKMFLNMKLKLVLKILNQIVKILKVKTLLLFLNLVHLILIIL